MRFAGLSGWIIAALLACISAGQAFEVEEHLQYPAVREVSVLRILSSADREAFDPILEAFRDANPTVTLDYTIASTSEVMRAIAEEGAAFDLVISSAMDLQTKLANDGLARNHRSDATATLPDWAIWRNQLFAFTQEPAVLILSETAFAKDEIPDTRDELIELLRNDPERFRGRIGTYDVRTSGFGYLMATQDARVAETVWRLFEAMGRLDARLYCCSGDMLSDIEAGELLIAYNVLGSYASARQSEGGKFRVVEMQDFSNVMLRTALIPHNATNVDDAGRMVDFLVTLGRRADLVSASGLPAIDASALSTNVALRPIRLGPGLLVFLDQLKRESFLRNWDASLNQD